MRRDQRLTNRQRAVACGERLSSIPDRRSKSAVLVWQFARKSWSSGVAELARASLRRITSSRV